MVFPANPPTGTVAFKVDQVGMLVTVQALDRIVQTRFGLNAWFRRKRIVGPGRPALFLRPTKQPILVRGRLAVVFKHVSAPGKDPFLMVVVWH